MVAVKGLKAVSFSEDEEYVTFDFTETSWSFDIVARLFGRIRDYMIDKHGTEEADKIINPYQIDALKEHAQNLENDASNDNSSSNYSEEEQPPKKEADMPDDNKAAEFAEEQAKFKAEKEKFNKEKVEFSEKQATQRKSDNENFLDKQISSGRIAAGAKAETLAFMESLEDDEAVSFSEKTSETPLAHFKNMISAANPIIDFSEQTGDENQDAAPAISDEDMKIMANDFMESEKEKGRTFTLVQAINHLKKGAENA
jgi:hypothetical protein